MSCAACATLWRYREANPALKVDGRRARLCLPLLGLALIPRDDRCEMIGGQAAARPLTDDLVEAAAAALRARLVVGGGGVRGSVR